MNKKTRIIRWLVIVSLVMLIFVFVRGMKDAMQGQQIEGVIANSEGGRYSALNTFVYVYEPDGVERLETSLQLFKGDGDVVPVTKNGTSYRVGSPLKIFVMSVLWIIWTLVLIIALILHKEDDSSLPESKSTVFSSVLLVSFVLLMAVGY